MPPRIGDEYRLNWSHGADGNWRLMTWPAIMVPNLERLPSVECSVDDAPDLTYSCGAEFTVQMRPKRGRRAKRAWKRMVRKLLGPNWHEEVRNGSK